MRKRLKKKLAARLAEATIEQSSGCVFCDLQICTAEKHIDEFISSPENKNRDVL